MGLRNRWEFTYTAAALVAPTRAKRDYHAERVAFWEGELADAKASAERAEQAMREAANEPKPRPYEDAPREGWVAMRGAPPDQLRVVAGIAGGGQTT